jgi:hypothetical protein
LFLVTYFRIHHRRAVEFDFDSAIAEQYIYIVSNLDVTMVHDQ